MNNNVEEIQDDVTSVAIKALTNDELHIQKFNEYLYQNYEYVKFSKSVVVTKAVSERLIKILPINIG